MLRARIAEELLLVLPKPRKEKAWCQDRITLVS